MLDSQEKIINFDGLKEVITHKTSEENIEELGKFFKNSNPEGKTNNSEENIWDKLRKDPSSLLSNNDKSSNEWTPITTTAAIAKSTNLSSTKLTTNEKSQQNGKEEDFTIMNGIVNYSIGNNSSESNTSLPLESSKSKNENNNIMEDFEKLVDINDSDEVNIITSNTSNDISIHQNENKDITSLVNKENKENIIGNNNDKNVNDITKQQQTVTKIIKTKNKKTILNIIPNSSKKPNGLLSWLQKGNKENIDINNKNNINNTNNENQMIIEKEKEEINKENTKKQNIIEDDSLNEVKMLLTNNESDIIDSQPKESVNDSIDNIIGSMKMNEINEKDDDYTVENLDQIDNEDNLSDDSFDLNMMFSTQDEEFGNSNKTRKSNRIIDDDDDDNDDDNDENVNISIPKTKNKMKKSIFLEDEAVESDDEDMKTLGLYTKQPKGDDEDEDDEDDENADDENIIQEEEELSEDDVNKIIELHR